jgi:hypothetical protein
MPVAGRPDAGSLNTSLYGEPSPPSMTGRDTNGEDALRFMSSARLEDPARDNTAFTHTHTHTYP